MRFANAPMPDCVPEYYREQQEKRDRQYDMAMQRRERYQENQRKLDDAAGAGLPILPFGGYGPCWECPDADHDTATGNDDDFCRVICRDPSCRCHRKRQDGGVSGTLRNRRHQRLLAMISFRR